MSPELLDHPRLDVGLFARLLEADLESVALADADQSERPAIAFDEVDQIRIVVQRPQGAVPLDLERPWYLQDRSVFVVAGHELAALSECRRLALAGIRPEVPIEIEASLRPASLRSSGREIVHGWLGADAAPLHLVFAPHAISFALFSPYPADLGATLFAIARQSSSFRLHEGWARALAEPPSRDVAALLAEALLLERPELLSERRAAERSVGLALGTAPLVTHGTFSATRGANIDDSIATPLATGLRLHLAASRSALLLAEIVIGALEAGRLASVTAVFEEQTATADIFSPPVFSLPEDALEHGAFARVQAAATLINQVVDSQWPRIDGGDEWGLPIRLLRLTRRASTIPGVRSEIPVCLVGHHSWDLSRDDPLEGTAPLRALRVALLAQFGRVTEPNSGLTRSYHRRKTRGS